MLWIDAIAQQGLAAFCIAALAELIGEHALAAEWNARYEAIRETVNRNYWDEKDGCYYDIGSKRGEFMKILTPASFWPLVSGMGTPAQAEALSRLLTDPEKLGGGIPLVSLSRDDADFNHEDGRYWRGSLWVPTAYAAIKGIERYGMYSLARELSGKILTHMYETFRQYEPHTIWECYHPERPEPARSCDEENRIVRPDFCRMPLFLIRTPVCFLPRGNAYSAFILPTSLRGSEREPLCGDLNRRKNSIKKGKPDRESD